MAAYFGLILSVLVLSMLAKTTLPDRARQERVILLWGMLAIFLLLALKKDTVGIDTAGYREQYLLSAETPWLDFDYVYFEEGFLLLMKLFSKAKLPFGVFTGAIYALLCSGYCRFLRKYSQDVTLSLLVVICYQFLVFHLSGLRQTLAMAVCLYAFLALEEGRRFRFFLLTGLAVTFHRSALVFFAVYPIAALRGRRLSWYVYALLTAGAVLLRPLVWWLVNRYLREISPAGIHLGGNLFFLSGMALFLLYTRAATGQNGFFAHMAMAAFLADILLSGSTLQRGSMYFTLFLIPGIPNAIRSYEPRTRLVLQLAMGGFLILLFYTQTLAINQLGILPYRFFWQ